MKKIFYTMFVVLMAAFTFASCEDVPAPYDIPSGGNDTPGTVETAEGDGTVGSPYNPLAVTNYIKTLEADAKSPDYVYIKGIVSSTKEISASYGNASFYISADGTTDGTQFYVYRIKGLGNKNIASDDEIKVGDEVVVCAKVVNYGGNTPETVQGDGWLYSLNGKTEGGADKPSTGVATGDGTKENPFNSVAASEYASKLEANAKSDKQVYIKGKVVSVKEQYGTTYSNATFYISDDGTENGQFCVYRALYLNNEKYTTGATLNPGDEVVVCGTVTNYMGNTPETVQGEAYLVSLTSNGGGEQPGGDTPGDASAANGDFENWTGGVPNNWKTSSSAGNATLSQSTDAHGGKYSVKVAGSTSANKRIAYKETELKAGEYTMTFYVKAGSATGASVRPGYVEVTDGSVGSYVYGDYTNDITAGSWIKVTHTFTIDKDGTYCLVIMNSKKPGGDVLIDDFTLVCGSETIIK